MSRKEREVKRHFSLLSLSDPLTPNGVMEKKQVTVVQKKKKKKNL